MSWMRCSQCGGLRKFGNVVDTKGGEYVQACPECDHAAYYIEPETPCRCGPEWNPRCPAHGIRPIERIQAETD